MMDRLKPPEICCLIQHKRGIGIFFVDFFSACTRNRDEANAIWFMVHGPAMNYEPSTNINQLKNYSALHIRSSIP